MDVKTRTELDALMNDFYGDDATRAGEAKRELLEYGRDLIRANQLSDYRDLITACAGVIADKGIDVTEAQRDVVGGRSRETSEVPAPIQLMKEFEEQAQTELGSLTTGAVEVTKTREIVEKLATVLSRQRQIMEKIQREPSSIEGFVSAIDKNNELSMKQIELENARLKHFKEYFPDDDAKSVINPTGSTYKDSQYDKAHRADEQVQLLEDLKTTLDELRKNEDERRKFEAQLTAGDPSAQDNIDACKRKEQELKEKISKVGPDGRETGIIQRLKDFKLNPTHLGNIDIDRAEAYSTKKARIDAILGDVKVERKNAYGELAQSVLETIDAKGPVDANSAKYTAAKVADVKAKCQSIIDDIATPALSEEDLKKAMQEVNGYVEFVRQDIQKTQDRVAEMNDAIEFRNRAKEDIERAKEADKTTAEEVDRLRREAPTDVEREAWLNDNIEVGEGADRRLVVARNQIQEEAQEEAEDAYRNNGRNAFTRAIRNALFRLTHGFKSRQTMIAERAESLARAKTDEYITERRQDQIDKVESRGNRAEAMTKKIEALSREARNDAAVHSAAHNAAANITEENILSGKDNPAVDSAENRMADDLSNMGYDIALQKWRNGEMTQADFDRVLKEHLENPENKARYANPDETKGYTKKPEYRNPERDERG